MNAARNLHAVRCAHANVDRGACRDCAKVFSEGRPANRVRPLSHAEQRREDELRHVQDLADARAVALGAVDVIGFYMALRASEKHAMGALERVMDAVVDFDVRCQLGDQDGAVVALRSFVAKIRGSR